MQIADRTKVTIRSARNEDAAACGRICFDAFDKLSTAHGFPPDFPSPGVAGAVLAGMFSSPHFYCVVAEHEGRVLGSNCLDERAVIAGVGPITVEPAEQNLQIGRKLMEAVIERSSSRGAPGMRLVQAAFHSRSLSLYTKLGFDIREPLACMQGRTTQRSMAGCVVRQATPEDLEACNHLSQRVHGFERGVEVSQAIGRRTARVVEREGKVTGYASDLAFFGHATAETNVDLQALLAAPASFGGPGVLIPTRNTALFRWCLMNDLRVVQPLTLMTLGLYSEPAGAWLPSILY